jgi:hypothetical protein
MIHPILAHGSAAGLGILLVVIAMLAVIAVSIPSRK